MDIPQGQLSLEYCDISSDSLSCVGIHGGEAVEIVSHCQIHDSKKGSGVFVYENGTGRLEKSALPSCTDPIASHIDIARYLSDWQIYHFHDTSDTAKVKQSGTIYDNERLRPQAENLAAFLFSIQNTEQYQKIVRWAYRRGLSANHPAGCPFLS